MDPSLQREGTGKILMEWVESQVLAQKGRIIVVETSGRDLYKPTRSFYLKIGYHEEARIRDFYRPGDDRVIFTKIL
ncbi:GNAT family N-acetyltransferase [bacterium]|nr:GNAT family N-acetyltransferase [bacterium]